MAHLYDSHITSDDGKHHFESMFPIREQFEREDEYIMMLGGIYTHRKEDGQGAMMQIYLTLGEGVKSKMAVNQVTVHKKMTEAGVSGLMVYLTDFVRKLDGVIAAYEHYILYAGPRIQAVEAGAVTRGRPPGDHPSAFDDDDDE